MAPPQPLGIQPSIIDEMVGLLKGWRSCRGLIIMLVEKHLEFLSALCDRIVLLDKGRVVREARPEEPGAVDELVRTAGFVD